MIDVKDEMSSMVVVLQKLNSDGYLTQFKASKNGLESVTTQKTYKPGQVHIVHFYRFEGESDPGDSSILYAIETNDGEKGTLIDSYGAESDPLIESFIKEVQDIQK
jgi:hypothetical protein